MSKKNAISTHAPHTRRDCFVEIPFNFSPDFYSRASYEARLTKIKKMNTTGNFYSRASYEARLDDVKMAEDAQDFYSRASYEARLFLLFRVLLLQEFLLTRLIRGATCLTMHLNLHTMNFYSRASYEARL